MKKSKSLMLLGHFCLAMMFIAIISPGALSAPIEVKAVTFTPAHLKKVKVQLAMLDKINERAKGKLTMKYLGARDIMEPKAMGMGVRNGIVDMAILPTSYYSGLVPTDMMTLLSRKSCEEERQCGFFDYQRELHKKAGLFLLGRANPLPKDVYYFRIITNKKATNIEDFAGTKISTGIMGVPFIKAIGASPISLPRSDTYSALQQGIVDGHVAATTEIFGLGWHKAIKYLIDVGFGGTAQVIIMNLKKWNSIPRPLQDIVLETHLEMEKIWTQQNNELMQTSLKKLQKAGVEFIKFQPEEATRFVNLFYKSSWEYVIKKHPEEAKRSKELLGE